MQRILVIRGGAIGDFVLTLPAIKLLRDAYPDSHIEILGYKHIIALAEHRFYADAIRSIEYAAFASFFARGAELPSELAHYFASFDLIVSYLFDPDRIFEANLRRCGVETFLACSPKVTGSEHASRQLAALMVELGLTLASSAAQLYPSCNDHIAASALVAAPPARLIALHPGSGSAKKNWSIVNWRALGEKLLSRGPDVALIVVGGEAETSLKVLCDAWSGARVTFVIGQPLTTLAAVIARCTVFLGHDSGISHIAGAVGTRSLVLFGPTDPSVWAPANDNVHVLRAPARDLAQLGVDEVYHRISALLSDARPASP
ncbi:MAG: glycosyltransferase family 9 protein [Chthoniobacterales bacterium]|nr:glycosyltransferase family 9 protein [Chthoniobacterales bacterium]